MGLSVLTLVKNRTEHLLRLVEGLRRSETAPVELIIVDMGSVPFQIPGTQFPIRILRLETDGLPLAEARNLAAKTAKSDKLLFLDVDCIPMAGLVDALENALLNQNNLVCAQVRYLSKNDILDHWTEDKLITVAADHPVRTFPSEGLRLETNPGLFWSLAFGIEHKRFMDLEGFDENFTGYGAEDTDFGFRACQSGMNLAFLGGTGVFHQYHEVFEPPLQHFRDIIRNAEIFYQKWNFWPMDGWLTAFKDMDLITLAEEKLSIKRFPNESDLQVVKQVKI